ncbi:class I adenylate-forming enzyme family protein [Candidatus Omnitrophota bacterium]
MNFSSLINQVAKRLPDKTALIENGYVVPYSELWNKVESLTRSLLELGLKKNDKIALILPNCKEFIYCFLAILRANLIAVPINPNLTNREIKEIFDNSNPRLVIAPVNIIKRIEENNKALLKKRIIVCIENKEDVYLKNSAKSILTIEALYRPKKEAVVHKIVTCNDQTASINYTYRGYGYPLGAVLTHGNYIHGAVGYLRLIEPELEQRFLLAMPMSHIFTLIGCVVVPLLRGSTVVIMKNIIPTHIFKAIKKYKIDFLIGVPTFYKVLLENYKPDYDISSLKYGISGGAYMNEQLYYEIKKRMNFQILQGYGLSETMPVICNTKKKVKPSSIGIPGHEVKIKIIDERGNRRKEGELGEILVGGPTVMKQYYKRKAETKEVCKNFWICTGDIGKIDKDGYLYFKELKKNIVKVGGNTVDLQEIENVLKSHPKVTAVYLKVRKDVLWGHTIEASIESKKGVEISQGEIRTICLENLAQYKIPRKIKILKKA